MYYTKRQRHLPPGRRLLYRDGRRIGDLVKSEIGWHVRLDDSLPTLGPPARRWQDLIDALNDATGIAAQAESGNPRLGGSGAQRRQL